jgi:hypothetical protein
MSTEATPQEAPPCERCGTRTYPTKRKMRMHQIHGGQAYPQDSVVPVWRCPSCGREMPREAETA